MNGAEPSVVRVAIINDMLFGGGRERRIVQLIAGLNELGIKDITLILLDERVDYPEIFDLDVTVFKIRRKHNRDFTVFPKIYRILKAAGPCVVNPWSYMSVFYAAPVSRLLGLPCLGAFVVDAKPPKRLSLNWLSMKAGFLLCKKIVGNSRAGHDAYGTPDGKRVVIYNGFNAARLSALPATRLSNSTIQIAMIGRLDKQKDYRTYIDALSILKTRGVSFRGFIVGQGEDLESLRIYAQARCGDDIHLTGFMQNVDTFISTLDIGVLCTDPMFHAEGISNALMEMMAQGKPVVATNGGGTPEIILDGINGMMVPANNPEALAEKLEKLCVNATLRRNLGGQARKTIAEKFTLSRMAREFRQVYNECL